MFRKQCSEVLTGEYNYLNEHNFLPIEITKTFAIKTNSQSIVFYSRPYSVLKKNLFLNPNEVCMTFFSLDWVT